LVGESSFIVIFLLVLGVGSLKKATANEGPHTVRVGDRTRAEAGRVGQVSSDRGLRLAPQFRNGSSWSTVNVIQSKIIEGMDIKVITSRIHGSN
jgi:hypothetical protein